VRDAARRASKLQETEQRGDPRRDRQRVPARANQELLDRLVTSPLLVSNFSQWPTLDGPLPERPPLVLT
jgi:hypothetical protein